MFLKEGLRVILSYVKEVLFPLFCLGCGKEGLALCDTCYLKIDKHLVLCCPVCHEPNLRGAPCFFCVADSCLDQQIACAPYDSKGLLAQVLHQFKYAYVYEFNSVLGRIIDETKIICSDFLFPIDYCVPIPLHKRRYAERGYNQSYIIAQSFNRHLPFQLRSDFLLRFLKTKQQAILSKEERKRNVADAFRVTKPVETKGKSILLVDDVYTTGSTMQAAARALKEQGGALHVMGFSLARG
ncbi:MAG: ComF family protein [Candidatus Magasanikbacteria bacterium]|nr:ComF family protein [Candidatus Magasanikbacteria bacterium]